MIKKILRIYFLLLCFLLNVTTLSALDKEKDVKIPFLSNITIDGKIDDWGDRGFRCEYFTTGPHKERLSVEDLDIKLRIGWNKEGLLVFVNVSDDVVLVKDPDSVKERDLLTIQSSLGNLKLSAGNNEITSADNSKGKKKKTKISKKKNAFLGKAECFNTAKGYGCELFIPFKNQEKEGDDISFTINICDWDNPKSTYTQTNTIKKLNLVLDKLEASSIIGKGYYSEFDKDIVLSFSASSGLIGKEFSVLEDDNILLKGTFETGDLGSKAKVKIPFSKVNDKTKLVLKVAEYGTIKNLTNGITIINSNLENTPSDSDFEPVVITVAPFLNSSFKESDLFYTMGWRNQVTANLSLNYSCIFVSRVNTKSLLAENQIQKIDSIMKDSEIKEIPAVDYVIGGTLYPHNKMVLTIFDLKNDDLRKVEVKALSYDRMTEAISKRVAKELNLQQKKKKQRTKRDKETWAVLPFSHLEDPNLMVDVINRKDDPLSWNAEMVLDKSDKIGKIVDRKNMEELLQELQLVSAGGDTESTAGSVARILGADKIITGNVSKYPSNMLRLDLFVIDGPTSVIVGSESAICSHGFLEETTTLLTRKLIENKYASPKKLPIANIENNKKEAKLYKDIAGFFGSSGFAENNAEHVLKRYILLHSAYQLMDKKESPIELYNIGLELNTNVVAACNVIRKFLPDSKYQKYLLILRELGYQLADEIFQRLEKINDMSKRPIVSFNPNPPPIFKRIDLRINSERFEEALSLLEIERQRGKHYSTYPKAEIEHQRAMSYIIIYCNLKEYEKTLSHFDKLHFGLLTNYLFMRNFTVLPLSDIQKLHYYRKFHILRTIGLDDCGFLLHALSLYKKIEGNKTLLQVIASDLNNAGRLFPEVILEIAKAHCELGNKRQAGLLLYSLLKYKNKHYGYKFINFKSVKEFDDYILIYAKKNGISLDKCACIKGKDINPPPNNRCIYFQPIGDVKKSILDRASKTISNFIGIPVKILPHIKLSELPGNVSFKTAGYDYDKLLDWVVSSHSLSDDALFRVVVINEASNHSFYRNHQDNGNFIFTTLRHTGKKFFDIQILKKIINSFLRSSHKSMPKNCLIQPCIFYSGAAYGAYIQDFMCLNCAEEYKKIDFEAVYRDFQEHNKIETAIKNQQGGN